MLLAARHMAMMAGKRKPTARDYVQSGIVAMWDGIENAGWGVHDANATEWKDLISGTYTTSTVANEFSENALLFESKNKKIDLGSALAVSAVSSGVFAVEIVGYMEEPKSARFYWLKDGSSSSDSQNISLMTHSSTAMFVLQKLGNLANVAIVPPSTFPCNAYLGMSVDITEQSGNNSYFYFDGAYNTARTLKRALASTSLNIASVLNGPVGKYYALRIYSRALTAAEIEANYAVDKARFNLP